MGERALINFYGTSRVSVVCVRACVCAFAQEPGAVCVDRGCRQPGAHGEVAALICKVRGVSISITGEQRNPLTLSGRPGGGFRNIGCASIERTTITIRWLRQKAA